MSAASIASFALSDAGAIYRDVCEYAHLDPGAPLEDVDDVLAFNLRGALMMARPRVVEADEPAEGKVITDLEHVMRQIR